MRTNLFYTLFGKGSQD